MSDTQSNLAPTGFDYVVEVTRDSINAVEFVFSKIEVLFEDLIKWLGFIFQWGDILRTHAGPQPGLRRVVLRPFASPQM